MDLHGQQLSEAETATRSGNLLACRVIFDKLEVAEITSWVKILKEAYSLFESLGCESKDPTIKENAFLCITCSGLLFLCVDKIFHAMEHWSLKHSRSIVALADDSLNKVEFFEAARAAYLALAAAEPERFLVVDAAQTVTEMQQQIRQRLRPLLD